MNTEDVGTIDNAIICKETTKEYRTKCAVQTHEDIIHRGARVTMEEMKRRYSWPIYEKEVR